MNLKQFIDKYNNKFVDFDGVYGPQCFDLYRQYCKEVLEVPQSPATGSQGAKAIWTTYLQGYFDRFSNSLINSPIPGDIVIWGTGIGPYGHVAVCWDANIMTFHSFDQNFPTGSPCHIQQHSYKGVLGWLRRKPQVVMDTLPEAPMMAPEPSKPPEVVLPPEMTITPPSELPSEPDVVPVELPKLNFFQRLIEFISKLLGR
jgi:hypothetical protein